MSRIIQIQNDFTSGELDPKLRARTDIDQYSSGLTTARNVSIQPQGGAKRRDGTKFIATLDSGAGTAVRMVPFEFSVSDSYMLVFTPGKMYVFKNGAQITAINGGGNFLTVASLTFAILPEMNWVQSADTVIVVHEDLAPLKIVRGATDADWTASVIDFDHIPKYAYEFDVHSPQFTITPSSTVGNITITASAVTTDNGTAQAGGANTITLKSASNYTLDDEPNGMFIEITAGTGSGQKRHVEDYVAATKLLTVYPAWATAPDGTSQYKVTAFSTAAEGEYAAVDSGFGRARYVEYVSDTEMKAYVEIPFFDTSGITKGKWNSEHGYEEVWSVTRGWPRSATFHEGRLYFGGSKGRPSTIWGSRVSDFFNFDPGEALDDAGVEATLDTGTFNAVVDIYSGRHLQVFTTGAEFYVPQALDEPITPTNMIVKQQTGFGMKPGIRLQNVDGSTLFIQRQGKALQEFIYSDTVQAYTSAKISLLSSHLLKSPGEMAVRKATGTDEGDRLLIVNDDDGSIACYTLLRSQNVIAPSEWITDGEFLNIGVDVDDIYTVVKRTINSSDVYYVELFDADALLDCSLVGGAAASVNVTHLEGETIKIIRDGIIEPDQIVPATPFTITFGTAAATSYQVGLNFTPEVKTLPVEPRLSSGSLKGFKKRIFEVNAELFETQSLTIDGKLVPFRRFGSGVFGGSVPEFTGIKTLHSMLGYNYDGQITIGQEVPLKMTLLGIDYKVSAGQ
jgi:bifunctional DNA-binding transcriptional regulator/antitoxin component of YhaV-PrlF toxin-antitoxin module